MVPIKQITHSTTKYSPAMKHKLALTSQTQRKQDKNSVKAMYGKKGFLNFLQNIFLYLTDKDKHQINFYFTIRDRIIDYCDRLTASPLDQPTSE